MRTTHHNDTVAVDGARLRLTVGGRTQIVYPDAILRVLERRDNRGTHLYFEGGDHLSTSIDFEDVLRALDKAEGANR